MNDVQALSDAELRKAVAQIAGYRVLEYEGFFYLVEPDKTIEQVVRGINNKGYAYTRYVSEDNAWRLASNYPRYHEDLTACWLLYTSFSLHWKLKSLHTNEYGCTLMDWITAVAHTPARAMCEAFLRWDEAKRQSESND